jgi:hypothetical protein
MCPVYVGCDGHDFIEVEPGATSLVKQIHLDDPENYTSTSVTLETQQTR